MPSLDELAHVEAEVVALQECLVNYPERTLKPLVTRGSDLLLEGLLSMVPSPCYPSIAQARSIFKRLAFVSASTT